MLILQQFNKLSQIAQITPYLYLSSATALTGAALARLEPSLVINVSKELPCLPSLRTVRLPLEDSPEEELTPHLPGLTRTIRQEAEQGGRVLVHCLAGVSRSVSLVLAYLVTFYCDLATAWRHVTTIRPWARPNNNFMQQLAQWENLKRRGDNLVVL